MRTKSKSYKAKNTVSVKQAIVLKKMVENGGKSGRRGGISEAARKAGYSEAYIKSGKLQKTKSWNNLIEDALPDQLLTNVHKELLEHEDWRARAVGLDKAYKIKRKYDNTLVLKNDITKLSDEELDEQIATLLAGVIKSVAQKSSDS